MALSSWVSSKNLPVVVAQPEGEQTLFLALGTNQHRHEQADAGAVHVFQPAEVQDDRLGAGRGGLGVRIHQDALGRAGDFTLDVQDAGPWR